MTCLWYIPNTVEPGHRGDDAVSGYGGGGAGTTWLVGSADDVRAALNAYADLGITHFVLSDTPYQRETARVGDAIVLSSRSPG